MKNNRYILESLASDLKRVALGLHRGSISMADRFEKEALKRKNEIVIGSVSPYIEALLTKVEETLKTTDNVKKTEDSLMYSTLIQNYSQTL